MSERSAKPEKEGENIEFSKVPGTLDILVEGGKYVQVWQGPFENLPVMYMVCRDVETGDDATYAASQFDVVGLRALNAEKTIPKEERPFALHIDEGVMITGMIVPRPGGGKLGSPSELEE